MKQVCVYLAAVASVLLGGPARADVLYQQTPASPAGLIMSSWWTPDDSDYDNYAWDAFILPDGGTVNEVRRRGGYQAGGGPLTGFTVEFWPSIGAGTQPDITASPVRYRISGNAGQTYVGTFNGISMYEYSATLDSGFVAEPGVKYWIQIEASINGIPFWGLATGNPGDGSHFQFIRGAHRYYHVSGDTTFTLLGTGACTGAMITQDPGGASCCASGAASFFAGASGSGTLSYQWERETSPGSGQYAVLADGPTGAWDGGGSGVGGIVSGSATDTLTIEADLTNGRLLTAAHAVRYRCTVTNGCGQASSAGAQFSVCVADFNCDGGVNTLDVLAFLNAWSAGGFEGDVNHDGAVNTLDVLFFLNAWSAGC